MTCSRCRRNRNRKALGFCESLQIQMKSKLVGYQVLVEYNGEWLDLRSSMATHGCSGTPGSVLAEVVLEAAGTAAETSRDLSSRHDKTMPLVLLKHFLFKELGR